MIYTCDACKFVFAAEDTDGQCPDCGKIAVRPATKDEIAEYERLQKEKEEW